MGLAASQCRLLFITSRQTDVSYKMQRVSNNQISLARDKADVAEEYNRRLNATKMVTSDSIDLSYNALMGSGAEAAGALSFLTDPNTGRVVLSDSLKSKLGLTDATGSGSDFKKVAGDKNAFIQKMVPDATTEQINNVTSSATTTTAASATTSVEKAGNAAIAKFGNYPNKKEDKSLSVNSLLELMGGDKVSGLTPEELIPSSRGLHATGSNKSGCTHCDEVGKMSYKDIANAQKPNHVILNIGDRKHDDDAAKDACANVTSIIKAIGGDIASALGISYSGSAFETEANKLAEQYTNAITKTGNAPAGTSTYMNYVYEGTRVYSAHINRKVATSYLQGVSTGTPRGTINPKPSTGVAAYRSSEDKRTGFVLDLTDLLQRLMSIAMYIQTGNSASGDGKYWNDGTNFFNGNNSLTMNSSSNFDVYKNSKGYTVGEYESKVNKFLQTDYFMTDSAEKAKVMEYIKSKSAGASANTDKPATTESSIKYYNSLYDKLSNAGWCSGGSEDTILAAFKKGLYNLEGKNYKNYQDIDEVKDTETQKGAEAWYSAELAKITVKEKGFERDMTQLQTEYNALNTEVESVKSIINKNIERSFQYCQG